jgi:hypothetical protein
MTGKDKNRSFHKAKSSQQDEFYTQLSVIERELMNYKQHFRGKVVYCNWDDPRVSNFFHYFSHNFERLGLKRLITTCYKTKKWTCLAEKTPNRLSIWNTMGEGTGLASPTPRKSAQST